MPLRAPKSHRNQQGFERLTAARGIRRFGHSFDLVHFQAIDQIVAPYSGAIKGFRNRRLNLLSTDEFGDLAAVFAAFGLVLGPAGSAKALRLLAPDFFPLWDRKIAGSYGIRLRTAGENGPEYVRFMAIVVRQIANLNGHGDHCGVLKRIGEFNYCRFAKGRLFADRIDDYATGGFPCSDPESATNLRKRSPKEES